MDTVLEAVGASPSTKRSIQNSSLEMLRNFIHRCFPRLQIGNVEEYSMELSYHELVQLFRDQENEFLLVDKLERRLREFKKEKVEFLSATAALRSIEDHNLFLSFFYFTAFWISFKFWCHRSFEFSFSQFSSLLCGAIDQMQRNEPITAKTNEPPLPSSSKLLFDFYESPCARGASTEMEKAEMILLRCSNYAIPVSADYP